jgi:hypothetical protein
LNYLCTAWQLGCSHWHHQDHLLVSNSFLYARPTPLGYHPVVTDPLSLYCILCGRRSCLSLGLSWRGLKTRWFAPCLSGGSTLTITFNTPGWEGTDHRTRHSHICQQAPTVSLQTIHSRKCSATVSFCMISSLNQVWRS